MDIHDEHGLMAMHQCRSAS